MHLHLFPLLKNTVSKERNRSASVRLFFDRLFGADEFEGFFGSASGRAPDFDVGDFAGVVERTNAKAAFTERFVLGDHDRESHVVEIDFDGAV